MTPADSRAPLEIASLIGVKRDGGELTAEQISALLGAYLDGEVSDAQMAAFLMAGVIRGFSTAEAVTLTEVVLGSGGAVELEGLCGPTVDKHSTGGVGDTTTLIVAPLLAAIGCRVAKLSGRGLGHTGGTLDKLESIPGFVTQLSMQTFREQVERVGLAICETTDMLVPADKRLYALRDVTGTVADPALIAASVMSKKIAGGAEHIVLDVKTGSGAFLTDVDASVSLAELCVAIGEQHGRRTAALVTDMSQPLGPAVGNALEVAAAVEVLRGERDGPLAELSIELAATAAQLTGVPAEEAARRVRDALSSGAALERFAAFVDAQGGDAQVAEDPWSVLETADVVVDWRPVDGVVQRILPRRLGELAATLGAGRQRLGDRVDPAVGIEVLVGVGGVVDAETGAAARVHARTHTDADRVVAELEEVFVVADTPVAAPELIRRRL